MPLPPPAVVLLEELDIFSKLAKPQIKALVQTGEVQVHKAGQIVFRQGDQSDGFHIVARGALDCYVWDDLLKIERPVSTFGRGDIFGEVGLLTGDTRSAFVRAREESETLVFSKDGFFELIEKHPKVLLNFARILAHRLAAATRASGIKFDQLAAHQITREIVQLLPLQVILRHRVLPVRREGRNVTLALVDPTDQVARNTAEQFLGQYAPSWVCVSGTDFELFRDKRLFDLVQDGGTATGPLPEQVTYLTTGTSDPIESASETAKALDEMLSNAINAGASDLHFEPGPQSVWVRARIDGRLIDVAPPLTYAQYKPIVSRIKVLSNLDIVESRLPQDSVLRIRYGNRNIDLRISTVPAPHAEAVACRLFDPQQRRLDLGSLMVSDAMLEVVRKLFQLPNGLLLVTGPTGSGKTTTLYAGLQLRQTSFPTHKIVTAEDPIEYELNGVTQVQVNPAIGLDYELILRSLLRQDPEVILVGEMRDRASMDIAMEAALTGHFVLSSLHTNDAFETMARLRQRGVESYVIASTIRGIVSQRLVPRLCSACREESPMPEALWSDLIRSGLADSAQPAKHWTAKGCGHCKMRGHNGRIALYEVLVSTPELKLALEKNANTRELEQSVAPGSFVSMRRYARHLLEQGLASAKDLIEVLPGQATIARL